ncbi:hypothetical protein V2J09_022483 [Rumex salicifolius]
MSAGIPTLLAAAFLLLLRWKVKLTDTPNPASAVLPAPVVVVESTSDPQVPCYFVFGDSLSDCGNNNHLKTLSKADYKPYGVDFPSPLPTGRFSDNRTFVDVLTELLGFDQLIPPFNESMTLDEAIQGVNYASGGAGILYETGRLNLFVKKKKLYHILEKKCGLQGEEISFYQQILHHQSVVEKFGSDINLTKCLYTINIGSNDYINNYYNDDYITSKIFSPTQFASYLMQYYRAYVEILYGLGARKIAFSLLTEIGCALGEIAAFNATSCVDSVNNATAIFNSKLAPLIVELNQQLPDAKFTYINATAIETSTIIGK